jgi:hypothetical protein
MIDTVTPNYMRCIEYLLSQPELWVLPVLVCPVIFIKHTIKKGAIGHIAHHLHNHFCIPFGPPLDCDTPINVFFVVQIEAM